MQTVVKTLIKQTKQWERDVPVNLPVITGEYEYRLKHGWNKSSVTIEK